MDYEPPPDVQTCAEPDIVALGEAVQAARELYWECAADKRPSRYPLSALPNWYPGHFRGQTAKELHVAIQDYADAAGIHFPEACRRVERVRAQLALREMRIAALMLEYCFTKHQSEATLQTLQTLIDGYICLAAAVGIDPDDAAYYVINHHPKCPQFA